MSDADYIRSVAKGYANSFVDAWAEHYRRLMQIAEKLEKLDEQINRS